MRMLSHQRRATSILRQRPQSSRKWMMARCAGKLWSDRPHVRMKMEKANLGFLGIAVLRAVPRGIGCCRESLELSLGMAFDPSFYSGRFRSLYLSSLVFHLACLDLLHYHAHPKLSSRLPSKATDTTTGITYCYSSCDPRSYMSTKLVSRPCAKSQITILCEAEHVSERSLGMRRQR